VSQLGLFLFGHPRLEQDGQTVELKSRKGLALLAYLAASGPSATRDTLATLLWPDNDQNRAR
jgi:DNA-binding SARP family transcriptional activator